MIYSLPLPNKFARRLCAMAVVTAANFGPVGTAIGNPDIPAEPPVEMTGELTVLHIDDFDRHHGEFVYLLEDKVHGKRFKLRFEGEPPSDLRSGATVKVRGWARGQELVMAADGTGSIETLASGVAVVSGDQSTLVMVANFTDATVSCPVEAIQDLMFTDPNNKSIDDFYRETSFGQVSFSGSVASPYALNYASTSSCSPGAWADAADAAAAADHIDVAAYSRKVYVMPASNSCGYAGLGQVGGTPSRSWIFRCDRADSYAHELGHSLGMGHAGTLTDEYADTSDVMGYGGWGLRQVNAPHKEHMGWVPPEQIVPVTQSGLYEIAPLELDPSTTIAPQTLKIAKPDTGGYYYLSYRQPIGFDANLAFTYLRRLTVHRYAGDGSPKRTYLLQTLADGQSFTDATNGVTVTQLSNLPDHVSLRVQLDETCTTGAPGVAVSPTDQSGAPGSSLSYAVSVTNTDWAGCPQTTFNLAYAVPVGWTGGVSPGSVILAPGQSGTATVTVTSAGSAADGAFGLTASATDSNKASHGNSASASYTVTTPCTRSAPDLTMSPSSQSSNAGSTLSYSVSLTNKDSASCPASTLDLAGTVPSGWSGSVYPATLTLNPGQSGSATLSVTSATSALAGAYSVKVNASDSVHAASGTGNYSVLADTQPPTAPTGLTAAVKAKTVSLSWKSATDNVAVAGYEVWRNGARIASTAGTSYADTVPGGGSYSYYVVAFDKAGNRSSPSNSVNVTVKGK